MHSMFAPHLVDFYKTGHHQMLPEGTEIIYSNLTPRSAKLAGQGPEGDGKMVFFGLQRFVQQYLIDSWNASFFSQPEDAVIARYQRRVDGAIGKGAADVDGFRALHRLGYLPIRIKALPEGSRVPMRVPVLTIVNTDPRFPWLTNYLETLLSAELWKPCVDASKAFDFRRLLQNAALDTVGSADFVPWQGHDFSMRGMSGVMDAANTGAAHLTCFTGTDTVAALDVVEEFYGPCTGVLGGSVPATEHMVMCMGGRETEIDTYRRLITQTNPSGVISIVSDTWDYFQVLDDYTRQLKDIILARKPNEQGLARVVFRPDSGDPVKIICGDPDAPVGSREYRGSVEILWDIFGGTTTAQGYRVLDTHVGLIYGDAITLDRAQAIIDGLRKKGFASTNIVFGIGSFTYQFVTRDSYSLAMKATWGQVHGEGRDLLKDPKTGDGGKKSATGLLRVERDAHGEFVLHDAQTPEQEQGGLLEPVFENGQMLRHQTMDDIRDRINAQLA